jgi:hypothetical protein
MADARSIIFSGRIYPERAYVGVSADGPGGALPLEFQVNTGARIPARILMDSAQVVVAMAAPEPLDDLLTLKNGVQSVVSSLADVVGWQNGCGYTVELTSYASSDGQGVFGVQIPVLAAKPRRIDTPTVFNLIMAGPDGLYLRRALADLRWAILSPDDTPFFCYRSLEALRRHFPGTARQARASMCTSLRVDDGWVVDCLQKPANEIRHGAVVPVTDLDRQRSLLAAREIIDRYMAWRISDGAGISAVDFPRLHRGDDPLLLKAQWDSQTGV